jgi:hypothetical protein
VTIQFTHDILRAMKLTAAMLAGVLDSQLPGTSTRIAVG